MREPVTLNPGAGATISPADLRLKRLPRNARLAPETPAARVNAKSVTGTICRVLSQCADDFPSATAATLVWMNGSGCGRASD